MAGKFSARCLLWLCAGYFYRKLAQEGGKLSWCASHNWNSWQIIVTRKISPYVKYLIVPFIIKNGSSISGSCSCHDKVFLARLRLAEIRTMARQNSNDMLQVQSTKVQEGIRLLQIEPLKTQVVTINSFSHLIASLITRLSKIVGYWLSRTSQRNNHWWLFCRLWIKCNWAWVTQIVRKG